MHARRSDARAGCTDALPTMIVPSATCFCAGRSLLLPGLGTDAKLRRSVLPVRTGRLADPFLFAMILIPPRLTRPAHLLRKGGSVLRKQVHPAAPHCSAYSQDLTLLCVARVPRRWSD